jgi:hypothetical protein
MRDHFDAALEALQQTEPKPYSAAQWLIGWLMVEVGYNQDEWDAIVQTMRDNEEENDADKAEQARETE